ncbi:MAG: hypothetical protein K8R54_07080 [Bacteroidales bacterium]|nr:hypothetical protein [Bacteroidales bacterium]
METNSAKYKYRYSMHESQYAYWLNCHRLVRLAEDNLKNIIADRDDFQAEMSNWDYYEDPVPDNYFHHKKEDLFDLDWLMLNSFYISLSSYFESFLKEIAEKTQSYLNSKINVKDINGHSDIDKFRKYLFLVGNLKSADSNNDFWGNIRKFKDIRNRLVHHNGSIIEDKSKPINQQNKYSFLIENNVEVCENTGQIRIKNLELINKYINLTYLIIDHLIKDIDDQ